MIAFSDQIYSASGVKAALDAFGDFGKFQWNEVAEDGYFNVEIQADDDIDPSELEGEFANFALARSLEKAQNVAG